MICQSVSLRNFRNVSEAHVDFCDGINLILGNNAQGKTNLLEAVALMAIGKSFRGAKEAEMIRFGQSAAEISLNYHDSLREQNVSLSLAENKRRVWMQNGNKVAKVTDMVGQFRVVIFMPEHLSIIKSGPELRRNFLDVALCQMRPRYLYCLQRYNGILKERNKLLKVARENGQTLSEIEPLLDVWTQQMVENAVPIAKFRAEFVERMRRAAGVVFAEMTDGRETPNFIYKGPLGFGEENVCADAATRIYDKIKSSWSLELAAGTTLHGTHRDDIEITLNGVSARSYASQGQQRSLSLAMKLAEGEISREEHGDYPVFLFDDVLSELDRGRREYLISKIRGRQVIMSGCEKIEIDGQGSVAHRVICVDGGTFTEQKE